MNNPTTQHAWDHLLKSKWTYIVIGCIAIVVYIFVDGRSANQKIANPTSPASGPEGTSINMSLPTGSQAPAQVTAVFTDPGEHGYVAMQQGGGTFVTYDPTKNLKYSAPATKNADGSYSFEAPAGMCGLNIVSAQEPAIPPKIVQVILTGPNGEPLPGAKPQSFALQCDKYTLNIKLDSSKDPVLPDGVDQTTITVTLSVTGPAQFVNGKRLGPHDQKPVLTSPLGLITVNFSTDLGVMNPPAPANIKTDKSGVATVTLSSSDAGIAKVRAVALGIGDASVNVHFPPKITGVKEDFVQPNSPTNYQISTIPANPKDLDFDWKVIYPQGPQCGSLTGAASGKALNKNGLYHGPTDNFPDGCNQAYEMAMQIQVTVTDKDGQSDTKTFTARGFEGQGVVKLP